MKKTGWIIGTIIFAALLFVFVILTILNSSNTDVAQDSSTDETAKSTQSAIDAFTAGVYYTQMVIDPNVEYDSYEAWKSDLKQARIYFETAQVYVDEMTATIEDSGLVGIQSAQPFSLFRTAYAAESHEIIQVYKTAEKGQRIKALADFLSSDMQYALSALEQADNEIAEHWNHVGDVWAAREGAARIVRSGCKVTVLTAVGIGVGIPSVPFAIPSAIVSLGGAGTAVQLTDDTAFILKGADDFDNCTYTYTNMKETTFGAVKNSVQWLFIDNRSGTLKTFDAIKDIRGIMTDKEFVGLNIQGDVATMTSGDLNDAVAYAQALRDGETLLDEIRSLQNKLALLNTGGTVSSTDETNIVSASESDLPALEGRFVDTTMNVNGTFDKVIEFFADGTYESYSVGVSGNNDEVTAFIEGTYTFEKASESKEYTYYILTDNGRGYHVYPDDISGNEVVSLFHGQNKKQ